MALSLFPRVRAAVAVVLLLALCAPESRARQGDAAPVPSATQMRLDRFVSDAAGRTEEYFALFKDLTADETKTVELFNGSGEVSRSRRIVSEIVVYQSQLDNSSMAEYRNVREVDGAPVAGREERVESLFAKARSGSIREELARISREGSRYDLDLTVSGLTIAQGLPLQAWARALFDFSVVGSDRIDGRDVVVLGYQQAAPNARFGLKFSLPSELGSAPPLYRGRLWIDAGTGQLWREQREVAVTHPSTSRPLVIQRTDFAYTLSRFGTLLPRRIVFTSLLRFARGEGGASEALPTRRVTFEYGPFKRYAASSDQVAVASDVPDAPEAAPARPAPEPPERPAPEPDASLGPEFGPDAPLGPPTGPPSRPAATPQPRRRPGVIRLVWAPIFEQPFVPFRLTLPAGLVGLLAPPAVAIPSAMPAPSPDGSPPARPRPTLRPPPS